MNKTIFNVIVVIFIIGAVLFFCGELYCQQTLDDDLKVFESLQPEDAGEYQLVRDGVCNYSIYNKTDMGIGGYRVANVKITIKGIVKVYSDEFEFNN